MGLMSKRSSAARLVAGSKNRINSKKRDFMRVPPMLAELERRREYYREGGTESAGGAADVGLGRLNGPVPFGTIRAISEHALMAIGGSPKETFLARPAYL